jgi:O-antigen/teichoic acid export membrane protein
VQESDEMAIVTKASGRDNTVRTAGLGAGVLSNSVFILLARGVQIASSAFILISIVRYLSVEKYGEYAYVVAFVASVMGLTYFGIQQVMIRETASDKNRAHLYLGSAILLRACLSIVGAVILIIAMMYLKPARIIVSAVLIAIIAEFFLTFGMLMKAVFQAFERMIYEPILTLVYVIILSSAIAAVIHFDMGLLWLLISAASANSVQFLLSTYIVSTRFICPSFDFDKDLFWALFKNSSMIGIGIFFYQNLFRIEVLMLKWLGSSEDVAFFQVSHGLIMQIEFLPAAFMSALFPYFARMSRHEPETLAIVYERYFRYIFILSVIPSIYLCQFSEEIVGIVFGSKYAQSYRSLSIISWAIIPLSMDMFFNNILIVMNKQRYTVIYGGLTLAVNFLAAYLLIPGYGFIAASYISLASYFVLFFFSLYFAVKSGLSVVLDKVMTNVVVASSIAVCVIYFLKPISLSGAVIMGFIAYPAMLIVTGTFPMEDRLLLIRSIKRFGKGRGRK